MSDNRLDKWALAISIASFLVSGLSAWYTRSQIGLTAGQIKAYVQVAEAKLAEPMVENGFVKVELKIKNFGQTAAVDVQGDMDYQENGPNLNGEGNRGTLRRFGSMGPGMERTVILTSNHRTRELPAPGGRGIYVYFYGTVWYTDDTSREDRKDDWCYWMLVKTQDDLQKTELRPCDIVTYDSKNDLRKGD